MDKNADQMLVRRVQKGDRRAFDLLVVKYQHKILALVARYIRDRAEVEDVAQEAFIKAFNALPRFRGESAFYTWLYRIAINTAKNYLVAQGRRPPGSDVEIADAEHFHGDSALKDIETPENALFRDELQRTVEVTRDRDTSRQRGAQAIRDIEPRSRNKIQPLAAGIGNFKVASLVGIGAAVAQ